MIKDRMDPLAGLSAAEIEAKKERVEEMGYTRKDVAFLFWTALKVFLPILLFFCVGYAIFWLLFKLWLS